MTAYPMRFHYVLPGERRRRRDGRWVAALALAVGGAVVWLALWSLFAEVVLP